MAYIVMLATVLTYLLLFLGPAAIDGLARTVGIGEETCSDIVLMSLVLLFPAHILVLRLCDENLG